MATATFKEVFEDLFKEVSNHLVQDICDSPSVGSSESLQEEINSSLHVQMNEYLNDMALAGLLLGQVTVFSVSSIEKMKEKLQKADIQEGILKSIKEFQDLRELFEISNTTVLEIYTLAKSYFDEKKYRESTALFSFLCMLNNSVAHFWIGKGLSEELQKRYDSSNASYIKAICLDPENSIDVAINIANNLVETKRFQLAISFIDNITEYIKYNIEGERASKIKECLEGIRKENF